MGNGQWRLGAAACCPARHAESARYSRSGCCPRLTKGTGSANFPRRCSDARRKGTLLHLYIKRAEQQLGPFFCACATPRHSLPPPAAHIFPPLATFFTFARGVSAGGDLQWLRLQGGGRGSWRQPVRARQRLNGRCFAARLPRRCCTTPFAATCVPALPVRGCERRGPTSTNGVGAGANERFLVAAFFLCICGMASFFSFPCLLARGVWA